MLGCIACLAVVSAAATPPRLPPEPPPTGVLGRPPGVPPAILPQFGYQDGPQGLRFTPLPRVHVQPKPPAPDGDPLGDVWEMQEIAGWNGVWLRRGKSRMFDGYWTHPTGERVRAPLEMWVNGYEAIVVRRHEDGRYCRYDGVITPDWIRIDGHYTCSWEKTPMPWRAQIVRMPDVLPQQLRQPRGRGQTGRAVNTAN